MGDRHAAVVGAGPGGLATAMLPAHWRFRVTVFEQRGQVGGRSADLPLGPCTFDIGPIRCVMDFMLDGGLVSTGGRSDDCLESLPLERLYPQTRADNLLNSFGQAQQEHTKADITRAFPGSEAAFDGLYGRVSARVRRHSVGAGAVGSWLHYGTG